MSKTKRKTRSDKLPLSHHAEPTFHACGYSGCRLVNISTANDTNDDTVEPKKDNSFLGDIIIN